jgi:hypothetical protein
MSNPDVLRSRLKLLQDDVEALLERLNKLTKEVQVFGGPRVQSHVDLKNKAFGQGTAITDLLTKIAQASNAGGWANYNEIRDSVAQINHEVLEIVQGLAIHRENIDERACWIVRRFLEGISGEPLGLTVFTARDLNVPTLGRLMRVRFPVKSIWTFPFAVHQFANLKIKDTPALVDFAKQAAAREVQALPPEISDVAQRKAEARALSRWTQIISDGLAVYFTGPCYAGSAILMRLSPAAAELDDDWQASELDRAFAILETLRQTDVKIEGEDSPYRGFIQWLEVQWNEMLIAGGSAGLPEERQKELGVFIKDLIKVADQTISYAKYPLNIIPYMEASGSWSTAEQWAKLWRESLRKEENLRTPTDVGPTSNIRDAFNAGWLCWSKTDDIRNVDVIAKAVLDLCGQIVEPYYEPQAQPLEPPGPPGTRGR